MVLDDSMIKLGCSPIKVQHVKDRISYGKRKIQSLHDSLAEKVSKVSDVPVLELHNNAQKSALTAQI